MIIHISDPYVRELLHKSSGRDITVMDNIFTVDVEFATIDFGYIKHHYK